MAAFARQGEGLVGARFRLTHPRGNGGSLAEVIRPILDRALAKSPGLCALLPGSRRAQSAESHLERSWRSRSTDRQLLLCKVMRRNRCRLYGITESEAQPRDESGGNPPGAGAAVRGPAACRARAPVRSSRLSMRRLTAARFDRRRHAAAVRGGAGPPGGSAGRVVVFGRGAGALRRSRLIQTIAEQAADGDIEHRDQKQSKCSREQHAADDAGADFMP